ncbi:MAG: hypothetical protein ACKVX7_18935 [Planctomycetota bacterium]
MLSVFKKICDKNGWQLVGDTATIGLGDGRKQSVHAEVVVDNDDELLRLYSVIGDAALLDEQRMSAALRLNAGLRHGAIAIRKQALVLTDTFLLREADHDEVKMSVQYLARMADQYEKTIYRTDKH